jgi:hypothetical protein
MNNFDQLEDASKKYSELKQHTELISESITIAVSIIDYVSSQNFSIPLQSKGVVSGGTTPAHEDTNSNQRYKVWSGRNHS